MTSFVSNQVAAGNGALLDAVHAFLTADATLVTASEEWVSLEFVAGDYFIIKGPGLAGTDEIFIGWRIINDVGNDVYNIEIKAFTGYQNGLIFNNQPGATDSIYLCSYNLPLNYWIIANGRRFIIVEKVSTVYLSAYCGFFLPYATPTQYPYPVFIGASTHSSGASIRWSSLSDIAHCMAGMGAAADSNGIFNTIAGGWFNIFGRNTTATGTLQTGANAIVISPFFGGIATTFRSGFRDNIDGSYSICKAIICDPFQPQIAGELEGIGWVTGFGNTSESTLVFDGDNWVVIQDVYRTAIQDYYAVRLL